MKASKQNSENVQPFNLLFVARFFNSGDFNHLLKNFPKQLNAAKTTSRKLKYLRKKRSSNAVYMGLANICKQIDLANMNQGDFEDNLNIF